MFVQSVNLCRLYNNCEFIFRLLNSSFPILVSVHFAFIRSLLRLSRFHFIFLSCSCCLVAAALLFLVYIANCAIIFAKSAPIPFFRCSFRCISSMASRICCCTRLATKRASCSALALRTDKNTTQQPQRKHDTQQQQQQQTNTQQPTYRTVSSLPPVLQSVLAAVRVQSARCRPAQRSRCQSAHTLASASSAPLLAQPPACQCVPGTRSIWPL